MTKNYYVLLGVASDATPDQIKAAYRHRALELHPDRTGTESEEFLAVQKAYETLSNPNKRERYDGRLGVRQSHNVTRQMSAETRRAQAGYAEPMRVPRRPPGGDISLTDSFETYAPSFEELFDRLWGNFEAVSRPKAEEIRSLTVDVPLTMDQARYGGQVQILIPARAECPTCRGHGVVAGYECWRCAGQGSMTADYPLAVAYPPGIFNDYVVELPLNGFGIENFYLTVRFRVTAGAW